MRKTYFVEVDDNDISGNAVYSRLEEDVKYYAEYDPEIEHFVLTIVREEYEKQVSDFLKKLTDKWHVGEIEDVDFIGEVCKFVDMNF